MDHSGVVKETAPAAEEPEMQLEEEEPPAPEDNRAFTQTLLGQRSTAGPWNASRSTGPPLPPHHPSARVRVRAKERALGSAPIPPGVAGLLPCNNL